MKKGWMTWLGSAIADPNSDAELTDIHHASSASSGLSFLTFFPLQVKESKPHYILCTGCINTQHRTSVGNCREVVELILVLEGVMVLFPSSATIGRVQLNCLALPALSPWMASRASLGPATQRKTHPSILPLSEHATLRGGTGRRSV